MIYTGNEAEPQITTAEGIIVYDERHKMMERGGSSDMVVRVGSGRLYSLSAGYKRKDLRGARRLLVTADVHDGKNWLVNARAVAVVTPP